MHQKDEATVQTTDEYYEDEDILTSYRRFHFGPGFLGVKNFPLRMAEVSVLEILIIFKKIVLNALH